MTELFNRIETILKEQGRCVVAIDGQSCAGKSTLTNLLQRRYGARDFHTGDYRLTPAQASEARLSEPGGFFDRERFLKEVIEPVKEGRDAYIRRYDCKTDMLAAPTPKPMRPLSVVEGCYSLHPRFGAYYDLSLFLQIRPELQQKRLVERYDAQTLERAKSEWLPREEAFFKAFKIAGCCDVVLDAAAL
jgi:uridine kinase